MIFKFLHLNQYIAFYLILNSFLIIALKTIKKDRTGIKDGNIKQFFFLALFHHLFEFNFKVYYQNLIAKLSRDHLPYNLISLILN
jgi:hypothetical protein